MVRSELVVNEVFESVAAFWCGGQPAPVAGRDAAEHVEERAGSHVVAVIDDHKAIDGRDFLDVVSARQPETFG